MSAVRTTRLAVVSAVAILLAGCAREVPPPSVQELVDNSIKLEAIMVRCQQNRSELRYEAECVNARQAVSIIEAQEERARRAALEEQSERKREALRRTQEAAAEARRRAAEAERLQREAEYLAQFGELPPDPVAAEQDIAEANAPSAVVPESEVDTAPVPVIGDSLPASDGSNAPAVDMDSEPAAEDLDAIREELRRRSGGDDQ